MLAVELGPEDSLAVGFKNALESEQSVLIRAAKKTDEVLAFAQSVAEGLAKRPRRLDCRYLYDALGSALYEQICKQPEYYPTRTEAGILERSAKRISDLTGPVTVVELGSGSAEKTGYLFSAYLEKYQTLRYVPIDLSASALEKATREITRGYPGVQVIAVNAAYEDALPVLRQVSPVMVVFMGSTIGNLDHKQAAEFWSRVSDYLSARDFFLLGVDLVKDEDILNAAYNDCAGVTEAFTRNLFSRINRELGADLEVTDIEHVAEFKAERRRVEIRARFTRPQTLRVEPQDRTFRIEAGEEILTEVSRKFRLDDLLPRLRNFGFATRSTFTDNLEWFASILLEREKDHEA